MTPNTARYGVITFTIPRTITSEPNTINNSMVSEDATVKLLAVVLEQLELTQRIDSAIDKARPALYALISTKASKCTQL